MSDIIHGFEPVFDADSRVFVLGSFPSVKSREVAFYYGNKQNRFWKMLSEFFGEEIGESAASRRDFVLGHGVALWDVVSECGIVGSSDSSIRNFRAAPIDKVLAAAPKIGLILLNGKKAYEIFSKRFGGIGTKYLLMPSTSPANPRYDKSVWFAALSEVFADRNKPAK